MKTKKKGREPLDLEGKEIGLWRVIKRAKPYVLPSGLKKTRWICQCSGCGTRRRIMTTSLRSDDSKGCTNCRRFQKANRNLKMVKFRIKRKWTYSKIANKYGVSVPRVKAVIDRELRRIADKYDITLNKLLKSKSILAKELKSKK